MKMKKNDPTKPACIIITRIQTLPSITNHWFKISLEFLKGLYLRLTSGLFS